MSKFQGTASVIALAIMGMAAPALAEDQAGSAPQARASADTNEIVVTAQRREERRVDVPIAIVALGQQQLQAANVQNLGDIQKLTPALRFDNQTGFFQPTIRGIGTSITTSGGGSNVGIYIDGFYSPNPMAADFQLTKVENIQVLKGPQGTLFGHNTTGGAILITTADPSSEPEVDMKASYGSFNAQKYQGYATFGLAKGLAADIEGIYSKGNGFVTNIVDNNDHVGKYENWTVRVGLKAELSDRVTALFRYQHSDMNDPTGQMLNSNTDSTIDITTGQPWGVQTRTVPGTFTTDPDKIAANQERIIHTRSDIAQITLKADLGFANLTSYSQFREEITNQSEDLDQTALPIFQLGLPIHDTTWSQELLLASKPGTRLQWTGGFFYFSNRDIYETYFDPGSLGGVNPLTGGALTERLRFGGSSTTTESFAGFADAQYQITDKLFLTAGVRYSHDVVRDAYWNTEFLLPFYELADGTKVPAPNGRVSVPGISSDHWTPRVVIRYKPTEDSSIYASYTKGYKAAIIDVGGSCQDGPAFTCNPIKPEDINAFELGYKFNNSRLSFEVSGFYYDYKNLQVSEFLGNAQAFILNAAKSELYGIDGEVHYKFGSHVQLNAGAAWTHGRYKQFGGQTVTDPQGNQIVSGAPIYASCPAVPATQAQIAGCPPANPLGFIYVNTDTTLHNVHMQHVPDFTATFQPRVTTGMTDKGEFALTGSLYYTSKIFFAPSGTQFEQPGYATLDLRFQWDSPNRRYMLAAFGTNVTNERYRTQVQYNGFGIGASWSQPASWGLEAGVKF
jgi:iron complex outermembrane receptor protein